jgi:hypothetical protein
MSGRLGCVVTAIFGVCVLVALGMIIAMLFAIV